MEVKYHPFYSEQEDITWHSRLDWTPRWTARTEDLPRQDSCLNFPQSCACNDNSQGRHGEGEGLTMEGWSERRRTSWATRSRFMATAWRGDLNWRSLQYSTQSYTARTGLTTPSIRSAVRLKKKKLYPLFHMSYIKFHLTNYLSLNPWNNPLILTTCIFIIFILALNLLNHIC